MGQKVNPVGIRLGISRDHNSVWFAEKDKYREILFNDFQVREFLKKELDNAFVSKIHIERPAQSAKEIDMAVEDMSPENVSVPTPMTDALANNTMAPLGTLTEQNDGGLMSNTPQQIA